MYTTSYNLASVQWTTPHNATEKITVRCARQHVCRPDPRQGMLEHRLKHVAAKTKTGHLYDNTPNRKPHNTRLQRRSVQKDRRVEGND